MRIFLTVLILTFNLQSWTKADDIKDFQIEGMSLGDSLLDFFSKKKINKFRNYDDLPSDMKFRIAEFYSKDMKMNTYDGIQIFYKPVDKKFILHSISGHIDCSEISQINCEKIFNEIKQDLNIIFKDVKPKEKSFEHFDDKSGESIVSMSTFTVDNGKISVSYTNWSDKMNYRDNVAVDVNTNEAINWMKNDYGTN